MDYAWDGIAELEYADPQRPLRVDDFIPSEDLSVERALAHIPAADRDGYAALYRWFEENSETTGSRLYGKRLPDVAFAHAAQRGIHAPAGREFAVSITAKRGSMYESDGQRFFLGDGTWVVYYSAHRNNTGGETNGVWNQKLFNCMREGIPVGLFLQEGNIEGAYLRALVFVEEYDPESELFTLHGPVTKATAGRFRSSMASRAPAQTDGTFSAAASAAELEKDERTYATVRQAVRTGQQQFRQKLLAAYGGRCAVTGQTTDKVLQAAHILDYRGIKTHVVQNGILLRSDIHLLFDSNLIGINPSSYRIEVNRGIPDSTYTKLEGHQLLLPADRALWPREDYLEAKFERFRCA